jgi:hypothetical protein
MKTKFELETCARSQYKVVPQGEKEKRGSDFYARFSDY